MIRRQLSAGLFVLFGLAYLAVTNVVEPTARDQAESAATTTARAISMSGQLHLERSLGAARSLVRSIARDVLPTEAASAQAQEGLARTLYDLQGARGRAALIDRKGGAVAQVGEGEGVASFVHVRAVQDALGGGASARIEAVEGFPMLTAAAPVEGSSSIAAVVTMTPLDGRFLRESSLIDTTSGGLLLLGQDGIVLASTLGNSAAKDFGAAGQKGKFVKVGRDSFAMVSAPFADDSGAAAKVVGLGLVDLRAAHQLDSAMQLIIIVLGGLSIAMVLVVGLFAPKPREEDEEEEERPVRIVRDETSPPASWASAAEGARRELAPTLKPAAPPNEEPEESEIVPGPSAPHAHALAAHLPAQAAAAPIEARAPAHAPSAPEAMAAPLAAPSPAPPSATPATSGASDVSGVPPTAAGGATLSSGMTPAPPGVAGSPPPKPARAPDPAGRPPVPSAPQPPAAAAVAAAVQTAGFTAIPAAGTGVTRGHGASPPPPNLGKRGPGSPGAAPPSPAAPHAPAPHAPMPAAAMPPAAPLGAPPAYGVGASAAPQQPGFGAGAAPQPGLGAQPRYPQPAAGSQSQGTLDAMVAVAMGGGHDGAPQPFASPFGGLGTPSPQAPIPSAIPSAFPAPPTPAWPAASVPPSPADSPTPFSSGFTPNPFGGDPFGGYTPVTGAMNLTPVQYPAGVPAFHSGPDTQPDLRQPRLSTLPMAEGVSARPSQLPMNGDFSAIAPFDEAHYRMVYNDFVGSKRRLGEQVENITFEGFSAKLRSSERALIDRHGCRAVRFQVQIKDNQVSLRPQLVR